MLFLAHSVLRAQLEIGLTTSPAAATFHSNFQQELEEYIFSLNYGAQIQYSHNRFLFTSGVMQLTQGRKQQWLFTTSDNPQGNGEYYDVFFRARSIIIPLTANYKFTTKGRSSFFAGLGLYTGIIYEQEQENTFYAEDWVQDPRINYSRPVGRYSYPEIYNPFYLGVNVGAGWKYQFSESFSLQLRPNLLYQLSKEKEPREDVYKRMMTWALDLSLFYRL